MALTLTRGQSDSTAKQLGERLRGSDPYPRAYELVHISEALCTDAVDIFERCDDDFDGLVDRTDPADLAREHNP